MSHPSALPATTPSDTRLLDAIERHQIIVKPDGYGGWDARVRGTLGGMREGYVRDGAFRLREAVVGLLERIGHPICPSEGSAPDTPTPEDDDDLANQVALQVLCRVFDDGVDVAMDEWRAFNAEGGFFWWARALGAFIRGRLDDQRVPPIAPDTQPDERLAAIRERLAGISPTPWEHVGYFNAMRHIAGCGQTDDNVPHYVVRREGSSLKPNGARADAEFIAHAPEDIAYLLRRLSSSPPEGEDTQRMDGQ